MISHSSTFRPSGAHTPAHPHTHALRSSAFTLIEVLVSMAIITVIVFMVANMFYDTSLAWDIGAEKAELTTAGRSAVDFMTRELSQAVAGPIDSAESGAAPCLPFRVEAVNQIAFLALSQEPSANTRALRGVGFRLYEDKLKYARITEALECYKSVCSLDIPTGATEHTLIDNVRSLEFIVYENLAGIQSETGVGAGTVLTNSLPAAVDIFLEVVSGHGGVKQFSTRVYFQNRQGYLER